jgi:hypothetical protein
MATFVFQCPNNGARVQGWTIEHMSDDADAYARVKCTACGGIHYVNPATGKVLGGTDTVP